MRITGWGASDVGRKRHHNEDSLLCNNELALFAVADGMGGHLGGERASRMAVEILEREIEKARAEGLLAKPAGELAPGEPHPIRALLRRAVIEADRSIYEVAMQNPALAGMGTTLTVLLFSGDTLHMGHVGDSRAYLYRDGRARQLTEDHSWIQEQVRAGVLSAHAAMKYLVPLARTDAAAAQQLATAIAPLKPTSREVGALYQGWQGGTARTRELILSSPKVFLQAQAVQTPTPPSATQRFLNDLGALGGIARRAYRTLQAGLLQQLLESERTEVLETFTRVNADMQRLIHRIDLESVFV